MSIAINHFRISHIVAMVEQVSNEDRLQKHIDFMLSVLPTGTKVVNVGRPPIVDLSMQFDIEFEHPFFAGDPLARRDPIHKIEADFMRIAWKEDDRVKEGTMFIGIRYLTLKHSTMI